MVKHTQTIRRLLPTNCLCLTILWGWHLKGSKSKSYKAILNIYPEIKLMSKSNKRKGRDKSNFMTKSIKLFESNLLRASKKSIGLNQTVSGNLEKNFTFYSRWHLRLWQKMFYALNWHLLFIISRTIFHSLSATLV